MRNVYNLSIRAWLLSLLCLLVGGRAVANEPQLPKPTNDHITVNDVTLVPGSADTYQVEISLVGSQIYTAYQPEFGISDSRFSCYVGFPTDAYYIYLPNNMDGKMQNCKVQIKFTL